MPRLKKQFVYHQEIRKPNMTKVILPNAPKMFPPTLPAKFTKHILKSVKVESFPKACEDLISNSTLEESEFDEEVRTSMERIKSEESPESYRKINVFEKRKRRLHYSKETKENQGPIPPDAPRLFPPTVPLQLQQSEKFKDSNAELNFHTNSTGNYVSLSYSSIPKIMHPLKPSKLGRVLEAVNYPQPSEDIKNQYHSIFEEFEAKYIKKRSRQKSSPTRPVRPDAPILFDPVPPQKLIFQNYGDPQKFFKYQIQNVLNS